MTLPTYGNSIYALAYLDHPRYENPVIATDPNLAWYSWSTESKTSYRSKLFEQADFYGGVVATIETQNEYDILELAFKDQIDFYAYVYLPGDILGVANFNKDFYGASDPDLLEWSTRDQTSGAAPEFAVVEIPLNLSITTSSTPIEGAGVFTTSINLSAGTEASGNLAEGANVYWQISGITAEDLASGALSGSGVITTDGKLSIDHSLVNDADSGETFNVSVFSDAAKTQQIGATAEFLIQEENNAPTDIGISATSFDENIPAGSVIGTLSATDPDAGSSFSYALVAGDGTNDADNNLVEIVGNEVRVKSGASIDFETNPTLNLNIQVTDNGTPGLTFTKALTAAVTNVNEAPTDITLTSSGIAENIPAGSVVGSFSTTDPDSGDTFSYSLVDDATTTISGVEVTDNALFTIDGNQLKINESPDFESKQSYYIRVQTTDSAGLFFQKEFTLGVNDLEEQIDPITGILGTPNQIKLRNRGRVKFTLFGSDDINVREIDLDSLIFGGDQIALTSETPLDGDYFEVAKRNRGKGKGTFFANFKDVNGDGKDDLIIRALRREVSSVMDRSDTELFAYAQAGDGTILFENTDVTFI